MIDEKKIKEAANTLYTGSKVLDANKKASFIRGVEWFKQAIWHDASEKPEFNRRLITQHITLMGELGYDLTTNIPAYSWEIYVKGAHITKWCYVEDLLPKGGEK